jgi:DNA-binding response OmpR family regulator
MDLSTKSCLIVEDDFLISEGLRMHVENAGVNHTSVFLNFSTAMEYLETSSPSFAILDVNLSEGATSIPIARTLNQREIPYIFLTGYGEVTDLDGQFKSVPVVTKPASSEELLQVIYELLNPQDRDKASFSQC